jgi:hypothetical protein
MNRKKTSPQRLKDASDRQRPKLNAIRGELGALDTRLSGTLNSHATTLSAHGSALSNHGGRIGNLEAFRNRSEGFAPQNIGRNNLSDRIIEGRHISPNSVGPTQMAGRHSNTYHDPKFAAAGHSHSISFKDVPTVERQAHIDTRHWLRNSWAAATTEGKLNNLRRAVLGLQHLTLDGPHMTAEEMHSRLLADPDFKFSEWNEQGTQPDASAYYYTVAGPDEGGGTANRACYIHATSNAVKPSAENPYDSFVTKIPDPHGLPGDVMIAVVVSDGSSDDPGAVIPTGWTIIGSHDNEVRTFWKVRTNSEPAAHDFRFPYAWYYASGIVSYSNISQGASIYAAAESYGTPLSANAPAGGIVVAVGQSAGLISGYATPPPGMVSRHRLQSPAASDHGSRVEYVDSFAPAANQVSPVWGQGVLEQKLIVLNPANPPS